jgi:hypothetical protein
VVGLKILNLGSEFVGIRAGVVSSRQHFIFCRGMAGVSAFVVLRRGVLCCRRRDGVGSPAVGSVLASATFLLRGTSGVQPRDNEQ